MAYIRLPLGVRVAMEFDWNGKPVVNVYHVTTTDPIVTVKLTAIANVFISWWAVTQSGNATANVELTGVTCLNLNVPNGEKILLPVSPPEPGTLTGDSVPNNVALVTALKTTQTGRSFQGRTYFAGLSEAEVAGNTLLAARVTSLLSAYSSLDSALAVLDVDLVVASFETGGSPRAEGIATYVDSFSANSRVDTQRRRLPKS